MHSCCCTAIIVLFCVTVHIVLNIWISYIKYGFKSEFYFGEHLNSNIIYKLYRNDNKTCIKLNRLCLLFAFYNGRTRQRYALFIYEAKTTMQLKTIRENKRRLSEFCNSTLYCCLAWEYRSIDLCLKRHRDETLQRPLLV